MPLIRSSASKCRAYIVAIILLFSKIMLLYFYYKKKKLVYIIITAPLSRQPSFYIKYTKLNIHLSCNIKSISNAKCL